MTKINHLIIPNELQSPLCYIIHACLTKYFQHNSIDIYALKNLSLYLYYISSTGPIYFAFDTYRHTYFSVNDPQIYTLLDPLISKSILTVYNTFKLINTNTPFSFNFSEYSISIEDFEITSFINHFLLPFISFEINPFILFFNTPLSINNQIDLVNFLSLNYSSIFNQPPIQFLKKFYFYDS